MSEHTPGPWTVHATMRDCVTFEGIYGEENLFLMNLDGYFACQNEADARLIAAAPELLEALRVIVENGGIGPEQMFRDARAAIAKATGEA